MIALWPRSLPSRPQVARCHQHIFVGPPFLVILVGTLGHAEVTAASCICLIRFGRIWWKLMKNDENKEISRSDMK